MTISNPVFIGAAGWSIPRASADHFPAEGGGLARYAARFRAVEVNTTFYKPHRPTTLERWAATVAPEFRFAVKAPKAITHDARLEGVEGFLDAFVEQACHLGDRLGPVLLQFPPNLAFDAERFGPACARLQANGLTVVCEPRHASWFEADVDAWMRGIGVARVAANPARHPNAGAPGGWRGITYYRLHGSPRVYYSPYGEARLRDLADQLARDPAEQIWCIFDNTASGAAAADALILAALIADGPESRS